MKKEVYMKFKLPVACALLAFAATSVFLHSESVNTPNLGRTDLKRMVQNARTSEDYLTLASYFRSRQQHFEQQAHDERAWFAQRSMNVSLPDAAKYPRPADSSKYRCEYFNYEAQKMSAQAAHFESLSSRADH
jgi:hypothetical protein